MKIGNEYDLVNEPTYVHTSGRYYEFNTVETNSTGRIVASVTLRGKDDKILVVDNMLIDTGAPFTTFDVSVMNDLEYSYFDLQATKMFGVGYKDARSLNKLQVSFFGIKRELSNVKFFDMQSREGHKGLIGMDLIQSIKLTIEGEDVYLLAEDEEQRVPPRW